MLKNALYLKLYGNKQIRKKRIRWLNNVVEGIWKRRKVGNKMKKEILWKREKNW